MAANELNSREGSLKDVVDAYFEKASREDVTKLLQEARSRLTEEAIVMWEGDDSDFFALPEDDTIECTVSVGAGEIELGEPVMLGRYSSADLPFVDSGSGRYEAVKNEECSERMSLAA